jgi:Na+-driven multidrug efflux pump
MSLGMGMATAMDTLCSQAATVQLEDTDFLLPHGQPEENETESETLRRHSKKKRRGGNPLVGIILQRGILIQLVLCLPIFGIWALSEPLLIALGQDPELSALAAELIRWTMPGLIPFMIFECLKKYLQAQGNIWEFRSTTAYNK